MSTPHSTSSTSLSRLEDRQGTLPTGMSSVSLLLAEFEDWIGEWEFEPGRWLAFDQFIRKQLRDICAASRVRCFRVNREEDVLDPLTPNREPFAPKITTRQGIYGYVITRGHRYIRNDGLLGPSVHRLAGEADDPPVWCVPISYDQRILGILNVGGLGPEISSDIPVLESLGCVISLLWGRLADRERMMSARRLDQDSGVLTRSHFFQTSALALAEGYAEHEPALVMVVALEGIRGLDDRGGWITRDKTVEAVGLAIRDKLRRDDIVGRFSDDRFVALMRRLDTSLGRMIARNLIETIQEIIEEICGPNEMIEIRCGLAGTGQKQPPLDELLAAGIAAAGRARERREAIADDLSLAEGEPE